MTRNIIETSGRVAFEKPNRMRWDYDPPDKQTIVGDGQSLWLYQPDMNQVIKAPLGEAFQASTPLTFLSGVFYSIHALPELWLRLSHANPFFYMIDGFRYGFFGLSDVAPAASLAVVSASLVAVSFACLALLRAGYKLRH